MNGSPHYCIGLPDGRAVWAYWHSDIAPAMRRVVNRLEYGKDGNPEDLWDIGLWMDENYIMSEICRESFIPGTTVICEHEAERLGIRMPATARAIPERANVTEIRQQLIDTYGFTYDQSNFLIKYTAQDPERPSKEWKVPISDGFITLRYYGLSRFVLEDHLDRKTSRKGLSIGREMAYSRRSNEIPARKRAVHPRREPDMPPARGRRTAPAPAPAPAPEPESNGVDYQKYLDKDISPTMTDYVQWFEDNVAALEDVPLDKLFVLGSSLYGHFQKSDFNIERREARKRERAPEPEPEPAPAPARRGRPRAATAAAAPAPAPAAAPARRGRGRPAKATAEAPY